MAQTFFPITPVKKTIGAEKAWTEINVSANIPVGATGVVIHLHYSRTDSAIFGLRKNGSTDDRTALLGDEDHTWAAIGVDGSRIFEAYIWEDRTNFDVWIVGYTMAGVTFHTNAKDYSLGTTTTWTPIDCTTDAPSAIGLIFEVFNSFLNVGMGLRKNGSSDDRTNDCSYHFEFGVIIGCDDSQIINGYIETTEVDFWLVGYITDGCTFILNATDLSLGATGSWLDLDALPDNAIMGFIEVIGGFNAFGLRKNGSGETIVTQAYDHPWAFVECDEDQLIEGNISNLNTDFFLVGYAEVPAEAGIANKSANMGAKMIAAGLI